MDSEGVETVAAGSSGEKLDREAFKNIKSKVQILDAEFHPTDNNLIAIGTINGKLKLYNVSNEKKRLLSVHKLHKKSIRKIQYAFGDANLVFTASKDKSIKLTDLNKGESVLTLDKAHQTSINCLKTIDNWLLASADDDGCVKMWDYRQKKATMDVKECDDYISDLAISDDKKVLLATSGEGTLSAFHTRKKKMVLQSELMDSELLCVAYMMGDKKVVCGTGEGVVDIFNKDEWGNISDRFPGHPSSIDCILPLGESVFLTGCFDGNIRACHIFPHRFMGIIGNHEDFPIQHLTMSSDKKVVASISHDECVKFWNVEGLEHKSIDPSSKSKSKVLKNKKLTVKGKSENFFADLIDEKESKDGDGDSDDDSDSDSEDFGSNDESGKSSDEDKSESESDSESEQDDEAKKPPVKRPAINIKELMKKRMKK